MMHVVCCVVCAQDVVAALVPDMGRARESIRITRGGIQRVLHGLGEALDPDVLSLSETQGGINGERALSPFALLERAAVHFCSRASCLCDVPVSRVLLTSFAVGSFVSLNLVPEACSCIR